MTDLEKRRAPAAVKAAMAAVEARRAIEGIDELLERVSDDHELYDGANAVAVVSALVLAGKAKDVALVMALETLEDIGRELDE